MNHLNWGRQSVPDISEKKNELKDLNKQFTECITKEYLPAFFAGKEVKVEDYCTDLRVKMLDLDKQVY